MTDSKQITAEQFEAATGRKPELDDLDRVNCPNAGQPGHRQCGWNEDKNAPVFEVGPFGVLEAFRPIAEAFMESQKQNSASPRFGFPGDAVRLPRQHDVL